MERYAASLAAASGNPSLSLGAAASLSPYSMLAAGYPPTALGLVPPSPLIQQPPPPDTMTSVVPTSLTLTGLPPRSVDLLQQPNHSQNSVSLPSPSAVPVSSNPTEGTRASSVITNSPVLQKRLSNPIEQSDNKDSTHLKVATKVSKIPSPSTVLKTSMI